MTPFGIRKKAYVFILIAVSFLAGCVSTPKPLYYWGDYEDLIYKMYLEPGSADPLTQVQKLTADIQQAQSQGLDVPPGVYAHLGYMYALQGSYSKSDEAFDTEMERFPEAIKFIDGMKKRALSAKEKDSDSE